MSNDWLSKDFVIELPKNTSEIKDGPKFSEKMPRPSKSLIDIDLYDKLIKTKDQINKYKNWSDISKLSNPYERVHNIAKSHIKVASRAYFKLREILIFFSIKDLFKRDITSMHLAEAPGSFVQALLQEFEPYKVDWYAQSLYSELTIDSDIYNSERWVKGGDDTGNLYNIENILAIKERVPKADVITADGGFNTDFDPNSQEQLTFQLIFAEVLTALIMQKVGPHSTFVCKIFDTFTRISCQLLGILTEHYDKVYIIKPRTSRYSNSEKYIVCIGFPKEINTENLQNILKKMKNEFCRDLGIDNENVAKVLYDFNNKLVENQIKYIEKSFEYSKFKGKQISYIEGIQNIKAFEFCNFFLNITQPRCRHDKCTVQEGNIKICEFCHDFIL